MIRKVVYWLILFFAEVLLMGMALAFELKTYRLPNGAKLVVKERDDVQSVALHVWFKVGSIYENHQEKGMAHFLEHMLFNGSEKYPYGEIDRIVESLGGRINAGTSKEYTFYHVEIGSPYWRDALDVLYQITQRPLLQESMIEKEKPIVIEEIKRSKDNPRALLWEEFEKLAYKVSNYRYPIIGYEDTVSKFTRDMLLNFYRNFYQPKNMYIVVVGNVKAEEVWEEVLKTFGSDEGRAVVKPDMLPEPQQIFTRSKRIEDPRVERAYWVIGWWAPPIGSKEYYALAVLDQILGTGRTSILYRELREKGIVYSVSAGDFGRPRDNIYTISMSFEPDRYEQVKNRTFELLKYLYENLTEEEVEKAKERVINAEAFATEAPESEAYYIGYSLTVVGTLDYYKFFESNIRSVRKVDILKVLEKYFLGKAYNEVLMVPKR